VNPFAELERLVAQQQPRLSQAEIAVRLGKSPNWVSYWAGKLSLRRKRPDQTTWPAERDAELEALREAGLSWGEVARRLGITKNAAIGRAWRRGLCTPVPLPAAAVAIVQLPAKGECAWPISAGPRSPATGFCREPVAPGRPYCAEHWARSWVAAPKQRAGGTA
jgi:GcrA cell cycle regulator